jgi:hypothetical protein
MTSFLAVAVTMAICGCGLTLAVNTAGAIDDDVLEVVDA